MGPEEEEKRKRFFFLPLFSFLISFFLVIFREATLYLFSVFDERHCSL